MQREPLTLLDVLDDIRRAWFFIAAGAVVGCSLAFLFLGAATPFFKAQMIVGPASPLEGAAISPHDSGRRQNTMNMMDFIRFENTFAGAQAAETLLKDEKIFQGLMYDRKMGMFRADTQWTPEKLAEYIRQRLRDEPVGETPLRRLVYFHPSPEFSAYFLRRVHQAADDQIRKAVRTDAAQRIAYLQKTIQASGNPEHRRALTELLMEEERVLMLASIGQPYAAAVMEPASASSRPRWPDRSLVLSAFLLAGAVAGFVVYGLWPRHAQ